MTSEKKIQFFSFAIFTAIGVFLLYSYLIRRYFHVSYPYGDFLFTPKDLFMDFFNINKGLQTLNPYKGGCQSYPPFILLIAHIISVLSSNTTSSAKEMFYSFSGRLSYLIVFGGMASIITVILYRKVRKASNCTVMQSLLFVCSVIMSVPFLFVLDRGNYLIFSLVFFILFCVNYETKSELSAVFLGLAAAIKIYPGLLCFIFLVDKRYRGFFISVASCIAVSLISMLFFEGSIIDQLRGFIHGLSGYSSGYSNWVMDIYFTTGLSTLIKLPLLLLFRFDIPSTIPVMFIHATISLALIAFTFISIQKYTCAWKKIMQLTALMVFIIPNSYVYTLTFLIGPLILFILNKESFSSDKILLSLLITLFIPLSYIYFGRSRNCISISIIVDIFALAGIVLFPLIENIQNKRYQIK